MVNRFFLSALLIFSCACLQAQNFESHGRPPTAPARYSWQWVHGQPIAFLVPSGWYSYSAGPGVSFMEMGNAGADRSFRTGFSFKMLRFEKDKFAAPEGQMTALSRFVGDEPDVEVLKDEIQPAANYLSTKCYHVVYQRQMPYGTLKGEQWLWYYRPSDKIFCCTFESPLEDWDKASLIGQEILGNIFISER